MGKKQYSLKDINEIFECEEGKEINLHLKNNDVYTGIFEGLVDGGDEDEVCLKALESDRMLGFKLSWIEFYSEKT